MLKTGTEVGNNALFGDAIKATGIKDGSMRPDLILSDFSITEDFALMLPEEECTTVQK